MAVTYKFTSMKSFADYVENKSREIGEKAGRTKLDNAFNKGEANAWFLLADLIRNTQIGGDTNEKNVDLR